MIRVPSPFLAILAVAAGLSLTAHAAAPAADAAPKDAHTPTDFGPPPFDLTDEARIATGKARFGANCAAYCHGFEGSGGKTPAFKGRKDLDPQAIFKVITEGRRGADVMPAWGNGRSHADESWKLVGFIRHLPKVTPEELKQMEAMNPRSPHEAMEEKEEDDFLNGASPQPENKP